MFAGSTIVLSYAVPVNTSVGVLWPGREVGWLWVSIFLFFSTPILFGSYICRALRLAVVFHPRAKRRLPWLIPVTIFLSFSSPFGTPCVCVVCVVALSAVVFIRYLYTA